ncbi:MAG TPA: PEP-CTERM sorting domain-containing protein [Bryobacteraceae bacterium]|jgi:hypothetical protein|nr:PEP-CTERM sorting domain-containing protein [Bryobacteraceae bacterium]
MKLITTALLSLLLLICGVVRADVTVGNDDTGTCVPFNCNLDQTASSPLDYQQVYTSTAFGGPISITSLTWYFANAFGGTPTMLPGSYSVYLSYTGALVGGLSGNLASNRGADYSLFSTFSGGQNLSPSFTTSGGPFLYDPSIDNLLVEFLVSNQPYQPNNGTFGYMETDQSGTITTRAFATPEFPDPSFGFANAARSDSGMVTTFGTSTVPEPATWPLVLAGLSALVGSAARRKTAQNKPRQ